VIRVDAGGDTAVFTLTEKGRQLSWNGSARKHTTGAISKASGVFRAGVEHRERCFLAANHVGKTEGVGGYELTCHLTGEYPDWWRGRTFDHPIEAWAAGDTSQTVRDIIQAKLLGRVGSFGTGLIRKALIARTTSRQGISDAVQDVYVTHKSGGTSWLTLKSYDQKRLSFQGTGKHVIWLDEEPDLGVYWNAYSDHDHEWTGDVHIYADARSI
jgi:hypothetical protein